MATFTMELWEVLALNGDPGFVDPTSTAAGDTIGLGAYPLFDESHRVILNEKILERYWNREIGMETISMFRLAMKRKLNEMMPYYNKLYLSELIEYDPLATFNLQTIREDNASQTSSGNTSTASGTNTKAASKSQSSDTPQNELPDNWEEDADYATSGAASQSVTNGTGTTTGTNTGTGETSATGNSTVKGFQGSAADLLGRYRAQIINIDAAILDMLNELFMGIWSNNEEVSHPFPYMSIEVDYHTFRPLGFPDPQVPDLTTLYDDATEGH